MAVESTKLNGLSGVLRKSITTGQSMANSTVASAPLDTPDLKHAVVNAAEATYLPGLELAKGLAGAIYSPIILKEQKELDAVNTRTMNTLFNELQDARSGGDEDRQKRIIKMMESTSKSPSLVEEFVSTLPTTQQIVADSTELALWTVSAYNPALSGVKTTTPFPWLTRSEVKAMNTLKNTLVESKLADATFIQKAITKSLPLLKDSAFGSAFFMAMKAQEEDATVDDIIRAGEYGAFIPPGFIVAAKGLAKGLKIGSKYFDKAIKNLEQRAVDVLTKDVGTTVTDEVLSTIGKQRTFKTVTAESFLKTVQASRQFSNRWIDRYSGINRFEDLLIDVRGGASLTENEKVYRDVRILDSLSLAEAENKAVKLLDDLRPYNDILDDKVSAYISLVDYIDRAKLGQMTPLGDDVGVLVNKLKTFISENSDDMIRIGEARRIVRDYQVDMLKIRYDAGLISNAEMNRLMKSHPNYIPHDVLAKIDESIITNFSSGTLNVSKNGMMKAVGSTRNIKDPLLVTLQHTPIITKLANKNKLLNNIVEAQELYGAVTGMEKIGANQKAIAGFEKISLFRNGVREFWQVPKDLAVSIKNADGIVSPAWFDNITKVQQALKAGATKYNLSFSVPNKFRDIQTAAITSQSFIDATSKRYGVKPIGAKYSQEEIKELYRVSGGMGASIFAEGEQKMLASLEKSGIAQHIKDYNPLAMSAKINESFEQSTRLNVFKRALENGLSPKDAALVSRDATIDFAKMGSWMQPVNRAIPFLNARVQGFVNLPKAFMQNPEAFARAQLFTSIYPTVLLHSHNRRYDSYKNISDYIKSRYWIVMVGETDAIDSRSGQKIKVPQFLTVPKGEGQALTSIPLQYYLDKSDQADYRKTSEMLADLIGNTTPISFQTFGSQNFYGSIASQLGPLVTVPVGLATNQNLFYGREIIPESRLEGPKEMQFRTTTPESTKMLANIVGVSPAQLEFTLDSFGGLPQDTQRVADMAVGLFSKQDVVAELREASVSGTEFGVSTQLPVIRSITREANEYYSPEMDYLRRQKEDIVEEAVGKTLSTSDRAEEYFRKLNSLDSEQGRLDYLNSLGDDLTEDVVAKMSQLKATRDTVEVLSKRDSVEVRANYILWRIDDLKQRGVSEKDRLKYLQDLVESKILTEDTIIRMAELKEFGQ